MIYRAAWVLPVAGPPIRNGWIRTEGSRILDLGSSAQLPSDSEDLDLGSAVVLPGLVNAHTHLELSWMRGRLSATDDFPGWIRSVIALQRSNPDQSFVEHSIADAIVEGHRTGTVLFGDISNSLASVPRLIEAGSHALVFHELIGFTGSRAAHLVESGASRLASLPRSERVGYGLAAHAPYSVSPALFRAIAHQRALGGRSRCSVHLGESKAEIEFLRSGRGPWRTLLEDIGVWDDSWSPPATGPVAYIDNLGFLDDRLLVVHGVHLSADELRALRKSQATLVTCPRGNRLTGAGRPPVADFYAEGVDVAIGTDSLASVPDLNLFNELAELHRIAPQVPAASLIESATIRGARALGFDGDFGTLEPGKRACLLSVTIPSGVDDPQRYLVEGISPQQISWAHE